jgi:hypothetical protein
VSDRLRSAGALLGGSVLAAVLLAAVGVWAVRSFDHDLGDVDGDDRLGADLDDALIRAEVTDRPVDLGEVVAGDWDRMVLICPYEGRAEAEQRLGFDWKEYPGGPGHDSTVDVVFADDTNVLAWSEVGRAVSLCPTPNVIERADAVVTARADGTFETAAG